MKIRAPFPKSDNYVAWGVAWVNGIAEVSEELGNKLIKKGYIRVSEEVEEKKPIKKRSKDKE